MKKITHKEIGIVLGVTASAITQRLNSSNGFYVSEAKKLSKHFSIPIEAWDDIKSYLKNGTKECTECTTTNQIKNIGVNDA